MADKRFSYSDVATKGSLTGRYGRNRDTNSYTFESSRVPNPTSYRYSRDTPSYSYNSLPRSGSDHYSPFGSSSYPKSSSYTTNRTTPKQDKKYDSLYKVSCHEEIIYYFCYILIHFHYSVQINSRLKCCIR